mgnify:CR=1 FL=1
MILRIGWNNSRLNTNSIAKRILGFFRLSDKKFFLSRYFTFTESSVFLND